MYWMYIEEMRCGPHYFSNYNYIGRRFAILFLVYMLLSRRETLPVAHVAPVQPASHTHEPLTHFPCTHDVGHAEKMCLFIGSIKITIEKLLY